MSPSSADSGTKRTAAPSIPVRVGEVEEVGDDRVVGRSSVEVDQVHLVDRHDEMRNAEQVRERGVPRASA